MIKPPLTLDDVRARAHPVYPTELLPGHESALMLFCAGFWGASDCIHVADAGVRRVIGVDLDTERVVAMQRLYPSSWHWVLQDAFRYAEHAAGQERSWDLVGVDPPIGLCARAARPEPWLAVARRTVVHGMLRENVPRAWTQDGHHDLGDGWRVMRLYERNDRAVWAVYQREPER